MFLRLEGRIAVASIPLAKAYVQYDEANHDTVSFGGHLGIDFGPVSMNADLDGAISGQTGDFFIQGRGEVCVGICIDAGALMSNVAVALCGGFHIGPLKLEAGAAYRFNPGKLEVFAGCDLDPYKPAIFRAQRGARRRRRSATSTWRHRTCRWRPAPTRWPSASTAARARPGAPSVTLTSPTGRVYQTAPTAGDYTFAAPRAGGGGVTQIGGALIDRDPVDHITTAVIVNPPAGNWQVQTPPPRRRSPRSTSPAATTSPTPRSRAASAAPRSMPRSPAWRDPGVHRCGVSPGEARPASGAGDRAPPASSACSCGCRRG